MSKKNHEEADSTAKNVEDMAEDIKDEKDNASNVDNSVDSNADVNEDSAVQAEDASDAEEQADSKKTAEHGTRPCDGAVSAACYGHGRGRLGDRRRRQHHTQRGRRLRLQDRSAGRL